MLPLLTDRLRLRLPRATDAAFFLELLNDPNFIRFTGDRHIRDLPGARAYVTKRLLPLFESHAFTLLVVERLSDDAPLGICGFVQRDYFDAPDLGFGFLERYCRQGIGFEAASACLQHGRTALGLSRIYGITLPDNLDSLRLLAKLGFRIDRQEVLPGHDQPNVVLSLDT